MQLWKKLLIAFATVAAIIGITIPLLVKFTDLFDPVSEWFSKDKSDNGKTIDDCSDVTCDEHMECVKEEGKPSTCTCISGYVSVERDPDEGNHTVCEKQECKKSSDCGTGKVCKKQKGPKKGNICVASADLDSCNKIKCGKTKECELVDEHPQCKCRSTLLPIVTETEGTSETRCLKTCDTTSKCEAGTLCFQQSSTAPLYCEDRNRIAVCANSLITCDTTVAECRLTPDNKPECLCKVGSTQIKPKRSGGTRRTCHTIVCADSSECGEDQLCYRDEFSAQKFCSADTRGCEGAVCPDDFHCEESGGKGQCVCDYDEVNQTDQATSIVYSTSNNGKAVSTRSCYRACSNADNCFPGTICFMDDSFLAKGCIADRSPDQVGQKCSKITCAGSSECLDTKPLADCFCKTGVTLIKRTETGSERVCGRTTCTHHVECTSQGANVVCYNDPFSKDKVCVEPGDIDTCDNVLCSQNVKCNTSTKICDTCSPGETLDSDGASCS